MTDQDNDDEIRESIPCVTVDSDGDVFCLPVGYDGYLRWRGTILDRRYEGDEGAWQHAIEREKARRTKAKGQTEARRALAEELRAVSERIKCSLHLNGRSADALDRIADMIEKGEMP
jgi:alkylated DNA nucleotide flippase Atl1